MLQQPVIDVSLQNADMLVTGIDAFIIKCSEVSERTNSLRNCLSRVKGTEREASVQDNIRRLDIYSRIVQFIPHQLRLQIEALKDMVDNQAVGNYLSQTSGGSHFLAVIREICYICENDIVYTKLVKVKFTSFYANLGLYAGNRKLGYDCLNLIEDLKENTYHFLKQLEQYETDVQARLYSYDKSTLLDDLDIVLNPSIDVLLMRINHIAGLVDGCVQDYYDEKATLRETQARLKSFVAQLTKLKSIIPLGYKESNDMLTTVDTRLKLCSISFNSVTTVEGARVLISSIYNNQNANVSAISFDDNYPDSSFEACNPSAEYDKSSQDTGQDMIFPLVEFKPQ